MAAVDGHLHDTMILTALLVSIWFYSSRAYNCCAEVSTATLLLAPILSHR